MQHLFTMASNAKDGFLLTHPHAFTIYLPKSKNGWAMDKDVYKTPEAWLNEVSRKLLLLGITEVQCLSVPPVSKNNETARFTFYFANAGERYRFEAAMLPNKAGLYKRCVDAQTPEQSWKQQKNIENFREATELDMSIHRESPTRLLITTCYNHDDLIVAMQIAEKHFDDGIRPSVANKVPLLLKRNENV